MKPILEIFSQGEELVTGQTIDTNSAWLSEQAIGLGFTVTRHTTVGDRLTDLVSLLQDIAERADCCICTGGLGPTSDDLTAEAVSQAFALPLLFDAVAYEHISRYFAQRNRPMPEANRKQAMLPTGASRIDNEWGTAPGFTLQQGRCWFAFLPGVPLEMKHLFEEQLLPTLRHRFQLQADVLVTLKTLGLGESAIQERINTIAIPPEVGVGFRAGSDDVQTKLLFPADYPQLERTRLVAAVNRQLGDYVFAIDAPEHPTGDLVAVIDRLMGEQNLTLAVVESASHGLLAAKCMGVAWLVSAEYSQATSHGELQALLAQSSQERLKLAIASQTTSKAKLALLQFYSGDRAALHDKNKSITLYSTLLADNTVFEAQHTVAGPLKRKQNQAALLTLDLLRRYLQGKVQALPEDV